MAKITAKIRVADYSVFKLCKTNPSDLGTLLDNFEAAARRADSNPDRLQSLRDIQNCRIAIFEKFAATDRQDREITDQAIGKAVNSIHLHVRRFMTPASPREHDFLRSIFREEIKKVVGGVL